MTCNLPVVGLSTVVEEDTPRRSSEDVHDGFGKPTAGRSAHDSGGGVSRNYRGAQTGTA